MNNEDCSRRCAFLYMHFTQGVHPGPVRTQRGKGIDTEEIAEALHFAPELLETASLRRCQLEGSSCFLYELQPNATRALPFIEGYGAPAARFRELLHVAAIPVADTSAQGMQIAKHGLANRS